MPLPGIAVYSGIAYRNAAGNAHLESARHALGWRADATVNGRDGMKSDPSAKDGPAFFDARIRKPRSLR